ncbi:transcriptional regulator GcvA [Marinivivus vitaminiproducens]|uniref:transcriptional regulator GcvA n=1 Tax=Marinivivus vitaminiproducens TaxID=3035935 RepID=UPI0027A8CE7B|nr:transcriptional regulator GcvA [Geminicoccaceae bacterium SCSIO 64248]
MPPRRLPPLTALRAFEAAARHLSFKRAADELGVTPTAISHQVRLLEETLGLRLFERRTRQVVTTADGQALYEATRDGLDVIARALSTLVRRPQHRVVTLSATPAFTARWLLPRVAAFRAANPGLDLRLHASDDPVDFHAGTVDAAIRYGVGPYPDLVALPLIEDRYAPVCSPMLGLADAGALRCQTLLHFEWRHARPDSPTWPRWFRQAGIDMTEAGRGITFTDEGHAVQAALAGQGVALLSLVLVADELASGALVQPFGPTLRGHRYHLVHPRHGYDGEAIEALRRWLEA